jgi:hypothetical protein
MPPAYGNALVRRESVPLDDPIHLPSELGKSHVRRLMPMLDGPLTLTETREVENLEQSPPSEAKEAVSAVDERTQPGALRQRKKVEVFGISNLLFSSSNEGVEPVLLASCSVKRFYKTGELRGIQFWKAEPLVNTGHITPFFVGRGWLGARTFLARLHGQIARLNEGSR